jgi:hypothetical protein
MRARPEIVAETTPQPDAARDNARGAAIMSLSMAGFVLNDALVKLSFDTLPIYQAILIRGVFATLLLTLASPGGAASCARRSRAPTAPSMHCAPPPKSARPSVF